MITTKQLLEAAEPRSTMLFLPNTHLPTKEVRDNVHAALKTPGKKHIFVSSHPDSKVDVNDRKSLLQKVSPNHDHMFKTAPTIYDAADQVHATGIQHLTVLSEPSQVNDIQSKLDKTHKTKFKSLTVKPLPNDIKSQGKQDFKTFHQQMDVNVTAAESKKLYNQMFSEAYEVGDTVQTGDIIGEIVNVHPKYVTIISEGQEHKAWLENIEFSDVKIKRNQLYKDSLIYKGYQTKNFNRSLSESLKAISSDALDTYAMLECIKTLDYLLGIDDKTIIETFNTVRIQTERLRRYSKKVGASFITENLLAAIDEELLKYSLIEGIKYTTTDRNMIAKVIGMTADINISTVDPTNLVNQAAIKLRTSKLTPPGWELLGRMFNAATRAGIRWNRDTFTQSIQKEMELI